MSRRGNCHDNAVAESFFNLLKRERIRRRTYKTRTEARQDVFDYIEMFYHPKRKHVRNGLLSPVEFERHQRVAPESHDDRLLLDRQHRRARLLGPGRQIGDRGPRFPLGDGLLIDPMTLGQRPQALLTMLYRSTDRLCRRGAPTQNLAHSASFDSEFKGAPSKPGIKHLAFLSPTAPGGDFGGEGEKQNTD
jgi:putative transposase